MIRSVETSAGEKIPGPKERSRGGWQYWSWHEGSVPLKASVLGGSLPVSGTQLPSSSQHPNRQGTGYFKEQKVQSLQNPWSECASPCPEYFPFYGDIKKRKTILSKVSVRKEGSWAFFVSLKYFVDVWGQCGGQWSTSDILSPFHHDCSLLHMPGSPVLFLSLPLTLP